jgi:hypothetical protein
MPEGMPGMPGMPGQRLIRIGFGGGMTVPIGEVDESWESGLNGQAYLLISPPFLPPFRLNLGYEKFNLKEAVQGATSGESTVVSGVAAIHLPLIRVGPISTYALAGLGAFRMDQMLSTGVDPEAKIEFGIDGGAGVQIRLGRLEGFVEGRVQNVYTEQGMIDTSTIRFVPLTFGILF